MSDSQNIECKDDIQPSTSSLGSTLSLNLTPTTDTTKENPDPNSTKGAKGQKTVIACPHCSFTTCMSQHMKSHLKSHERHQGNMYECDICKMQFGQKSNMTRHRISHSGVKPFECRFCNKTFYRKDQMEEHAVTHIKKFSGFECPGTLCNEKFIQHSELTAHFEKAHLISATNPVACKCCNWMFTNSNRLLLHYLSEHGNFVNPPKQENSRKRKKLSNGNALSTDPANIGLGSSLLSMCLNQLKTNPKKDGEEKECNHCGITFDENQMCLLHNSLHTTGDPFTCSLCGTQCGDKYMFTAHLVFSYHSH